jgi:hypothetical protein
MVITVGKAGLTSPRRLPNDQHLPNSFLNQGIEVPRRPKKSSLTLEEYRTLCDKLNGAGALSPNNADTTKDNIRNIQKKWIRYGSRRPT